MKVCVIGGNGYIGIHTVCELVNQNHEVVVISKSINNKEKQFCKNVRFYQEDIMNKTKISTILNIENTNKKIDVIMHFAGLLDVKESIEHKEKYYEINVEGTRNILDSMNENDIKNIVFSSTSLVYGKLEGECWSEESKTSPINPYGETKLKAENLIKEFCKNNNMRYCIFRYFNVAGANEKEEIGLDKLNSKFLIPSVVETALKIRKNDFIVSGNDFNTKDGTCVRDFVHVEDVAKANILGAEYITQQKENLLLNLGSGIGTSVLEIVNIVSKYYKFNYKIEKRRMGDTAKIIANVTKIKKVLGWLPAKTIEDIIISDIKYRKKINNIN